MDVLPSILLKLENTEFHENVKFVFDERKYLQGHPQQIVLSEIA